MIRAAFGALALALTLPLTTAPALACAPDQAACETALGSYHISLPATDAPADGYPFVMFLHGAGGTSEGVFRMSGMVGQFLDRGYAVIAPQGLSWRGRRGGIWSFLPETQRPRARDEAAFFAQIQSDAVERHQLSAAPGLLAGFSAGGFMVNYLACETPDAFAAYAPVSGGFWRPHPTDCAGPVRLFHTHGWKDGTVPLEGRPLGQIYVQGDVFEGLALWRDTNGCARHAPSGHRETDDFQRRFWTCAPGSALEFALFDGGHGVPNGWANMVLDWMEALPERGY